MAEIVYPPVIASARVSFKAMGLKFDVVGSEHVPTSGGAVLASNHISYLDFIFDGLAAQPSKRLVRFMAKDSVFSNKISGPLMRGMHHIPVDRAAGAGAFQSAIKALQDGEVIGIFPEATISRSYLIKDLKSGAARLAADAGVPLIPMVTWGGQRIMSKGTKRSFKRGRTIGITVGAPLYPSKGDDANEVTAQLKQSLEALLEVTIARYPDSPSGDADRWWVPAKLGGTAPTLEEAEELDHQDAAAKRARRAEKSKSRKS